MTTHGNASDMGIDAPGRRLRALMDAGCVSAPGAFNGLVARAAREAGFDALYVSGAAVSASAGLPDIGLVTLEGFCRVIGEVARASGLPVIADADTAFGEGEMAARTVWEYARAGAAGFHIEDQVFPKRCGHLDGKALVPVEHMIEKIRSAARARDAHTAGQFVLCARTDARGVEGLDATISRAKAYIDAGADMIFPEGLETEAEFAKVAQALKGYGPKRGAYLLANMTEFGKTPSIPVARFAELGYSIVIFPVSTLRSAMGEVQRLLTALKRDGHVNGVIDRMQDRKSLYNLLGYQPGREWEFPGRKEGER